jgi:dihydrofolate reductase
MGLVLWHVTMSLDGFIAGPDDAMEWVFEYPGPNEAVAEAIETIGTIVVGRRSYEVEDRNRGGFYGGAWTGPFFVLTHNPPETAPEWMTGKFVSNGIESAAAQAKAAAGEKKRRHLRRQHRRAVSRRGSSGRDPRAPRARHAR